MDKDMVTFLICAGVFVLVIIVLIKGLFWLGRDVKRPRSKQEVLQAHFNQKAQQQPDGPGAGLKKMKGWKRLFWIAIAILLAYLLISGGFLEKL